MRNGVREGNNLTKPTITYGHEFLEDCDAITGWTEDAAPTLGGTSCTILRGDIFEIEGTPAGAGDESTYWQNNTPNFNSDDYTHYVVRWKTSASSDGLGARVVLGYPGGTQELLESTGIPQYSAYWKVTSGTITPGENIQWIRFYADDYPNTVAAGPFQVYYDFALLCKNYFTWPHVAPGGINMQFPNRYVDIGIPGRGSPITQYMGGAEPIMITLRGDMKSGEKWGSLTGGLADNSLETYGEYLAKVWLEADTDPWQWFESDLVKCKVTPRAPVLKQVSDNKAYRVYEYPLAYYSLSDIDDYPVLTGLGVET